MGRGSCVKLMRPCGVVIPSGTKRSEVESRNLLPPAASSQNSSVIWHPESCIHILNPRTPNLEPTPGTQFAKP